MWVDFHVNITVKAAQNPSECMADRLRLGPLTSAVGSPILGTNSKPLESKALGDAESCASNRPVCFLLKRFLKTLTPMRQRLIGRSTGRKMGAEHMGYHCCSW